METKKCTTCQLNQSTANFSRAKTTKDGFHSHCKSCAVEKTRLYRLKKKTEAHLHYLENKAEIDAARDLERELRLFAQQERKKAYVAKNKDKIRANQKRFMQNNPWMSAHTTNMNRMKNKNLLPNLTSSERLSIKNLYRKAHELTIETGIKHQVDHIVAICNGGLHHPSNLQILTAKDNVQKFFEEDSKVRG